MVLDDASQRKMIDRIACVGTLVIHSLTPTGVIHSMISHWNVSALELGEVYDNANVASLGDLVKVRAKCFESVYF